MEYHKAKKPKLRTAKTPNERVSDFRSENLEVKVQVGQGKLRERDDSQKQGSTAEVS